VGNAYWKGISLVLKGKFLLQIWWKFDVTRKYVIPEDTCNNKKLFKYISKNLSSKF
jgi:hypothetical protein